MARFHFVTTFLLLSLPLGCVDDVQPPGRSTIDVLVVDGTLTNLAEPQLLWLSRSKAFNPTDGANRLPITGATAELVIDSARVVAYRETEPGRYELAAGWRGEPGHRYQLRVTLADGSRYVSTPERMPTPVPLGPLTVRFNPQSFGPTLLGGQRAAHEFFTDVADPAAQPNYYRWDWKAWEVQEYCRSCVQGVYAVYAVDPFTGESGTRLYEDCFYPGPNYIPPVNRVFYINDYPCRTPCWEILSSTTLNLLADTFTNGGLIRQQRIAQVPFYEYRPGLIELRQSALTGAAYRFFNQLAEQFQNPSGLADAPPTAPVGNVRNVVDSRENVVGYFTVAAVSARRYWLSRRDGVGPVPGLFQSLNGRPPSPEPEWPQVTILNGPQRPPTAVCVPSDTRTPIPPEGWQGL